MCHTGSASTRSSPCLWQCRSYLNRYLETVWWVACSVCKLKSWSVLEQMEAGGGVGGFSWMCRMASIPPRERRLRRKICSKINGCYWEAFNGCSDSIIHVFLLLSIYCGIPLIDNLVSCPLIRKDVRLYNRVSLSQCQNILGNGCSFAIHFKKKKITKGWCREQQRKSSTRAAPCQRTHLLPNRHTL